MSLVKCKVGASSHTCQADRMLDLGQEPSLSGLDSLEPEQAGELF